jgi:hypothetical protein
LGPGGSPKKIVVAWPISVAVQGMAAAASRTIERWPRHLDLTNSERELKRSCVCVFNAGQKKGAD